MVCKIRMILDTLSDGKWHSISCLTEELRMADNDVEERLAFLSRFDLARVDVTDGKVKINKDFQRLPETSSI